MLNYHALWAAAVGSAADAGRPTLSRHNTRPTGPNTKDDSLKYQGKLTHWNDDKGFGFVEPNGGGERSFVHIKSFKKRSRRPIEGDLIVYQQVKDAKGKFKAVNTMLIADRKASLNTPKKRSKTGAPSKFAASIAPVFYCVLLGAVLFRLIPIEVLYLYLATGLVTFLLYAKDKSAAQAGGWRTPESQLHLLSLIGGWPGAYYAQQTLRHKSAKREFRQVYWATVVINIAAFAWLFTQQGRQLLAGLLA